MTIERTHLTLLTAAAVSMAGIVGCWPEPASESVMTGTWKVISIATTNPGLESMFLTLDSGGELTTVSYTLAGSATVTLDDPPAAVKVDGDSISIAATENGNGLAFEGTLDSTTAPTKATGTLTSNLIVGGVTVSVDRGPATLVKQ